jgi:hypothetical protein
LGVGHGDQVVAAVVPVERGLAKVVPLSLEPIQTVVEVGGQEDFVGYA